MNIIMGRDFMLDKIIELYKENEHGEELVKDIEKVQRMQHVSPRAKEFLKHGIEGLTTIHIEVNSLACSHTLNPEAILCERSKTSPG